MIGTVLALLLALLGAGWTPPGPDLPECDPAAGIVTDCVQPQGPWETEGREIGDGRAPAAEPADAATAPPSYTG